MKDSRIFPLKLRAERDNLITAGACRLFQRLASWRYRVKDAPADAEWSLSWRDMAGCFGAGPEKIKRPETIYAWLRELVLHRYLFYCGIHGCPGRSCYRIQFYFPERETLFEWVASRSPRHTQLVVIEGILQDSVSGKNRQLVGGKNRQLVGGKNRAPIYSYSLREEMYNPEGRNSRPASPAQADEGGSNGSLRSNEKAGEETGSLRSKGSAPRPSLPSNWNDLKTKAGLGSS